MKRGRDEQNVSFTLNRRFWRNYFKPLICKHLSPLSRACLLNAVFPALSEIIREEAIIGDRAFATTEITEQQVIYYRLHEFDEFQEYAARSNRPELFRLVKNNGEFDFYLLESDNIEMYQFLLDKPFSCTHYTLSCILSPLRDDPERIRLLKFHDYNERFIYQEAIKLGAWKTAKALNPDMLPWLVSDVLQGAIVSKNYEQIDQSLKNPDVSLSGFNAADFDVLLYVHNRLHVTLERFVKSCKTVDQAHKIVELLHAGYFGSDTKCDFDNFRSSFQVFEILNAAGIFVFLFRYRRDDVELTKFLLENDCLNRLEALLYAANHLDFVVLNFVAQHVIFDDYNSSLLVEIAIRKRSMRLLRFARRMGAIPNHSHCNMAIDYNNRYMYLWLTRRVRSVKQLYLVLAHLRAKKWFQEEKELLNVLFRRVNNEHSVPNPPRSEV